MPAPRPPLGGLSAKVFLRDYWQKCPLLVRQALPGFKGPFDKRAILSLAASDEAESRLVERGRGTRGWRVTHGPISRRVLAGLPQRNWTLLVNGVNLHSSDADALLRQFAFVSWARLDDVMLSYAADGGGVGPHVDSYDVFLLQGAGRRRWKLMPPRPLGREMPLVANAPLKLIADFRATSEVTLEAGDMLYLPPGWGHDGTALGACFTYSIGLRAPRGAELSFAFLDFLHERGFRDTRYSDPERIPAAHPGRIDAHMVDHAARSLADIRWNRSEVVDFIGRYLSEPRQHVVFAPPPRPLARSVFLRRLAREQVRLDPRSILLACGGKFFMNGESVVANALARPPLLALADDRAIEGGRLARAQAGELIFDWYRQGFLNLARSR